MVACVPLQQHFLEMRFDLNKRTTTSQIGPLKAFILLILCIRYTETFLPDFQGFFFKCFVDIIIRLTYLRGISDSGIASLNAIQKLLYRCNDV